MATGIAVAQANTALEAIRSSSPYVKLHVGDPGAAGTANPAGVTTRQAVTFGAASGGVMTNTAIVTWLAQGTAEDATHFSIWNASTGGTFQYSGTIVANAYGVGDNYSVAVAGITLTITGAS